MTTLRCKWIKMEFNASLDDLSNALYRNRFKVGEKVGYDVEFLDHKSLLATYIEKLILNEKIIYPSGEEQFLEYERYSYVKFCLTHISKNIYILRVQDAPKSLAGFFNSIKSILESSLSIESIKIDASCVIKYIMASPIFSQVKISQAKFSGIKISDESSAKIEVNSISNALEDFSRKFEDESYILDAAKLLLKHEKTQITLELKRSCVTTSSSKLLRIIESEIIYPSLYAECNER